MKTLKLADGLTLPLEAVTEKLCWLGRTGSGKTYGAMKLAELMLEAGAQIGALDPVGVWRALRVPAVKGGPSFEVVVFGGLYGDLPLESHAGELIADLVVDRGLSFVLDVSQFIPSEQQRFVRVFADRFFHRKKSAPSAVHLFMEECQEFIPENPSGEEARTLGVMQRLWKLGRNFGIGGSLISQRPQEISKKALNMSGTMFAFQMTGPQERKTVRAWVADHGVSTDIERVLQTLATGEPHVESPTFLEVSKTVRILPRVTADLSSTPKVGASTAAKRPLTPIDVEQLKTSMAATIEKAKADDPKELRKQLAEAKALLAKKDAVLAEVDVRTKRIEGKLATTGAKSQRATDTQAIKELKGELAKRQRALEQAMKILVKVKALDFPIETEDDRKALELAIAAAVKQVTAPIEKRVTALASRVEGIRQVAADAEKAITALLSESIDLTVQVAPRPPFEVTAPAASRTPRISQKSDTGDGEHLTPAKQRILNALAWLEGIGRPSAERAVVAFLAKTSSKSSAYENNVSALRTGGFLEYPGPNLLTLTPNGRAAAVPPATRLGPEDLHEELQAMLPPAQWRILKAVIEHYPDGLSRAVLAEHAHTSDASSAFENNVSRLRTLGLLTYPSQGHVAGSGLLFLEATT